jgi:sugar phosphate isomerase/epimerase
VTLAVPEIGLGCASLLSATLPELIDAAERAGFRRITVRPYAFAEALRAGWTEDTLRRRLADAGIAVTMIDAIAGALPGTLERADADMLARLPPDALEPVPEAECFRTATALGASIVNLTHYLGRTLTLDVAADAVGGVCRRAAPDDLRICLEFIPDSGLPDLAFAQAVVEACGEPNASILLDVFHLDRSGGTVDDVRALPPGAIAGIQLSDRRRPPPGTAHVPLSGRLLPGDGELPLRELVEAALGNSPDATIDVEVLNDELRALSPADAAARLFGASQAWRRAWAAPMSRSSSHAEPGTENPPR